MIADILFKPMSVFIAVCIVLSFLVCSTIVTRTASNYQIRERSMRLANGLVAYGQKNNGFDKNIIYKTYEYSSEQTQTRNVEGIIEEMLQACELEGKCNITYYTSEDNKHNLYSSGSINNINATGLTRLNNGDPFYIEVQPLYNNYIGTGTFPGKPIILRGQAHGYIKVNNNGG